MKKYVYILLIIYFFCLNCKINKNIKNGIPENIKPYINSYCDSISTSFPKLKLKNIFLERLNTKGLVIYQGVYIDPILIRENGLNKFIVYEYKYNSNHIYLIDFNKNSSKIKNKFPFQPSIEGDFSVVGFKIYQKEDLVYFKKTNPYPALIWASVIPKTEILKLQNKK